MSQQSINVKLKQNVMKLTPYKDDFKSKYKQDYEQLTLAALRIPTDSDNPQQIPVDLSRNTQKQISIHKNLRPNSPPRIVRFKQAPITTNYLQPQGFIPANLSAGRAGSNSKKRSLSPDELMIRKVKINLLFKDKDRVGSADDSKRIKNNHMSNGNSIDGGNQQRYCLESSPQKIQRILRSASPKKTIETSTTKNLWMNQQQKALRGIVNSEERAKTQWEAHQAVKKQVEESQGKRQKSDSNSNSKKSPIVRIRPLSPDDRRNFQNIRFLNEISRPGSAKLSGKQVDFLNPRNSDRNITTNIENDEFDLDDSLFRLRQIFVNSRKNQVSFTPKPADCSQTHTEEAQKAFVDTYKNIHRIEEKFETLNSPGRKRNPQEAKLMDNYMSNPISPIQAILMKQRDFNVLPRKMQIIHRKQNSKELNLQHIRMGEKSSDVLFAGINRMNSLQILSVSHSGLQETQMQELVKNLPCSLHEIDLSHNPLSNATISQFFKEIDSKQIELFTFKADDAQLSDNEAELLFTGLQYMRKLRVISVSQNTITNKSCFAIQDAIKNLRCLREIYFHWNSIKGEGGSLILDECSVMNTVKVCDMSHNQLGQASNTQIFINAFKRLCDANSNESLIHLDISNNYFNINDCLAMAKALQLNQSIIGLHFAAGHDCFVSSQGFIQQQYAKDLLELNSSPQIHRIDSCRQNLKISGKLCQFPQQFRYLFVCMIITKRFKQYNEYHLRQQTDEQMKVRQGDNCWICEGWYEHLFKWNLIPGEQEYLHTMYLHLEIDNYVPLKMNSSKSDPGNFYLTRIVPPRCQIRYFFSLDGHSAVKIAKDQPQTQEIRGILVNLTSKTIDHSQKSFILETILANEKSWTQRIERLKTQIEVQSQPGGAKNLIEDLKAQLISEEKRVKKEKLNRQYQVIDKMVFFQPIRNKIIHEFKQFNVLHTGKFQNVVEISQNQDNIMYKLLISQRPRTFLQGKDKNLRKQSQAQWEISTSIFKDCLLEDENSDLNIFETQQLLRRCFEIDWEYCKERFLNEFPFLNEDEILQIKQELSKQYGFIHNAYKHLSGLNSTNDIPSVSATVFIEFISKCKILDAELLKSSDIDRCFQETKKAGKINKKNLGINRCQFLEIILRIAETKYITNSNSNNNHLSMEKQQQQYQESSQTTLSEAVLLLLDDGYLQGIKSYPNQQKWRQYQLWTEQCDQCFTFYSQLITAILKKYSENSLKKKSQQNSLLMSDFAQLCEQSGIITKSFTIRDMNSLFTQSLRSICEENDDPRVMNLQEFMEVIGRIAHRTVNSKLNKLTQSAVNAKIAQNLKEQLKNNKLKTKESNSSIEFSDDEPENHQQNNSNRIGLLKLHYKIESLLYIMYQKCTNKEMKDSFAFPTATIFKE